MENKERPLVTYQKRADTTNRVLFPKFWIENNGRDFLMEVYKEKVIIKPIKKEEK